MTSYDLRKTGDFKKMQDDLQIMPLINEHLKSLDVTPTSKPSSPMPTTKPAPLPKT